MKSETLKLVRSYVDGEINAEHFAENFFDFFRVERDNNIFILCADDYEVLTTIFCNLDCYNPQANKSEYEISADTLLKRVRYLLGILDSGGNVSLACEDVMFIS